MGRLVVAEGSATDALAFADTWRGEHQPSGLLGNHCAMPAFQALPEQLVKRHARPRSPILVAELGGRTVTCGTTQEIALDASRFEPVWVEEAARGRGAAERTL